ncbi:MAG: hypothetical protein LV479_12010 [Methylacidiphilales bacterium]|nr:hypothetical protein [Candidatus Methylacidiphilales bacterium]
MRRPLLIALGVLFAIVVILIAYAANYSSYTEVVSIERFSPPEPSAQEAVNTSLVEKVENRLPQKLDALGVVNSRQVGIQWTAYYVTPVKFVPPKKGVPVTFIDRDGKKHQIFLTRDAYDRAEVEAVAVGVDKQGNERFAYRVSRGVWRELPEGSAGMGNKMNTLVPMIHVAAEQKKYPYATMIFLPIAVGVKLSGGAPMDGYFWVSDTGSGVKGNHFDLFVGDEKAYQDFLSRDKKPTYETTIYPLPEPPKGFDPRTDGGLAAILQSQDIFKDESKPVDDEKLVEALLLFQRANPHIPRAEYGDPNGATTLWFLTQAAMKAANVK